MIRRPKAKLIAPLILTGALLAGGTAAIAAETWNGSDEDSPVDVPFRRTASKEDMQARKAEMQERLTAKVESGEITQAEADDIRAKMADRKAKFEQGERPSKEDMQARKAEMQDRVTAKVESGEITQAEADDIRAKMADRKAKFEQRRDAKN